MKNRLLVGLAVLVAALATAAVAAASIGGDHPVVTINSPIPTNGDQMTVGGTLSDHGHPLAGKTVSVTGYPGSTCSGEGVSFEPQPTDSNGAYTSSWFGVIGDTYSFRTTYRYGEGLYDRVYSDCVPVTLTAGTGAAPPPPDQAFVASGTAPFGQVSSAMDVSRAQQLLDGTCTCQDGTYRTPIAYQLADGTWEQSANPPTGYVDTHTAVGDDAINGAAGWVAIPVAFVLDSFAQVKGSLMAGYDFYWVPASGSGG